MHSTHINDETLSPGRHAAALDDELAIGAMRLALQPLSPQQLDVSTARLRAYLAAKIPTSHILRFDAAARQVEIIRRRVMSVPATAPIKHAPTHNLGGAA